MSCSLTLFNGFTAFSYMFRLFRAIFRLNLEGCVYICICVYVYVYTHTHTHTLKQLAPYAERPSCCSEVIFLSHFIVLSAVCKQYLLTVCFHFIFTVSVLIFCRHLFSFGTKNYIRRIKVDPSHATFSLTCSFE